MTSTFQPLKRTFFRAAETRWILTISAGVALLLWSWFAPSSIPGPYGLYLGPVGVLGRYLGENFPGVLTGLVYFTVVAHIGEAIYALKLCWDHNLTAATSAKWFFQTLAFGFASLSILRKRASGTQL